MINKEEIKDLLDPENLRDYLVLLGLSVFDYKTIELMIQAKDKVLYSSGERYLIDQAALGILFVSVLATFYIAYERINEIRLRDVHRN